MKKFLLFCFCVLSLSLFSQNISSGWTISGEPSKNFIENNSQFSGRDKLPDSKILFGIDRNGTQIYFTKQGMTYRFDVRQKKDKREEEKERIKENKKMTAEKWAEHEKEERSVKIETDLVHLQWANANPDVQVIAEELSSDYYSYMAGKENINHIKGYKKLIYKNLYPNIDVEYVFHPQDGIKYSLILHPGADASQVKMIYSGSKNISSDAKGNIHIPTLFGDIVDHSPKTFYADNKNSIVDSRFVKNGKTITFSLGNYDKTKTVVIDPWVQTPTLAASNGVWECERDGVGNVYIIGGETPLKLLKYNAAGTLQWTYSTPYDTIGGDWLGTFATDLAGNSYVTNGSTAALTKVTTSAGVVYSVTGGAMDEYWNIAFNCDQTKLIIGGTRLTGIPTITGSGVIFDINTANGSVNSMKTVAYVTPGPFIGNNPNEVRSITSSHNGRYYYLTLDSMGCIDQNFSACSAGGAPIFKINSGYKFGYKCENYRPNNGNAGIMSIRANKNFVYTQNGTNIQKRSLANGSILATAAIPGGISTASFGFNQVGNSGIDIDTCGNVYVGSGNAVIKYDANLNQLSSVALPFAVYDVSVSTAGNVIVAGSTGTSASTSRTGYVQSIASFTACDPLKLQCCDATVCTAGPFCSTDPAQTLSSSTSGGTWSGTGITNTSTGVFDPSVSGTGTFTITYNISCGKDSMQIVVKSCATPTVCVEPNGDLTVSGGVGPYHWDVWTTGTSTPITTQAQCTACNASYTWFFGQCLNGVMPVTTCTTVASYQQYATGTTATPPGTWPIEVVDANGNTLVINSLSGIPACGSTPLSATATHSNPNCNGQCTGTATVNSVGGTPPLTYSWNSTPAQSTAMASGLCAGNYTVIVTDAAATTTTANVSITQPTVLTSTATMTSASCGSGGSASVTANGGMPAYTYVWNPGGLTPSTITGLSAGNYTATVTDANGCTTTSTVSINSASGGTVSVTSNNILCNGNSTGTANTTMNGGTSPFTYNWTSGQTTSSVTNLPAGNYTVTVTDASGCTTTQSVAITQPTAITSSISVTNTTCGSSTGSAAVTASGGAGSLSYSWSNGPVTSSISGLGVGNYTCTITDGNGCTQTQTANIVNANGPLATISSQTNPTCSNGSNGSATATATGGVSPYTYSWNTAPPQNSQTATGLTAGTYSVTVADAGGCTNTQTVVITAPAAGPTAVAGTSTTILQGGSAGLTASGGVSYSWNNGGGNSPNITVSPIATTVYCVTVSDAGGCTDSACVTIYVETPCGDLFVPNAFSPNNNGQNEIECVMGSCIQTLEFVIYDRWGNKVFETTDAKVCWDGVYKGKLMNTAVFVYYLDATLTNGEKINRKGNISLIR